MSPQQVRASHILVKDRAQCTDLRNRILDGSADFATLAKQYSQCPSGQTDGDLGLFGRGQMVPAFDAAAFEQPVGKVGECIETEFGSHLILVKEQQ